MWQWFLRIVQIAVFGAIALLDYVENVSGDKKVYGLLIAGVCAFGATQALVGIRSLLTNWKRRASTKQIR